MTTGISLVRKDYCFLWVHKKNAEGYGCLRYKGKLFAAHRVIWEGLNGPIPVGLCVLHRCDIPSCFNPNHLFVGTRSENNKDRAKKGRSAIGERAGRSKLTTLAVLAIRDLYKTGNYTTTNLGSRFGVSNHQISMVVRKQSWRHI